MEQQNIPNRQDVYLTQAPNINEERKKDLKDAYNLKAARILGVVHITYGLIAFSSEINMIENQHPRFIRIGTGIWTSVFFFVSGGLAIGGAQSGRKCVVVATMVMSIISAVCAGILLIMSSINMANNRSWNYNDQYFHKNPVASYVLLILSGLAMLIAAIVSASLTCKPLCCRLVRQEFVHPPLFRGQLGTLGGNSPWGGDFFPPFKL